MHSFTAFDPGNRYILTPIIVSDRAGRLRDYVALLDTGAPSTEFSDEVLLHLGFLAHLNRDVTLKNGLQTQKYGRTTIPHIEICSRAINDLEVYVSHFEKSWGVDALVGIDFFRRFCVTINYRSAQIITEPYQQQQIHM